MDTVARFGGDEFVVMLSELNADKVLAGNEAIRVAEKIRAFLAETYFLQSQVDEIPGICVEHNCSSSIGVVLFDGSEVSQEDIFKRADEAMYLAKEGGRNKVRFIEAKID
jgi:diguanylate cyclase (GGDEF)-like protein